MNRLRIATKEEIEKVKACADLDQGCTVLALDTERGTGLAVRRICNEIDPMVLPDEWNTKLRALFTRDLETMMAAQGTLHYYFNVAATDEDWMKVVENWGAEQVSPAPMIRFKRTL